MELQFDIELHFYHKPSIQYSKKMYKGKKLEESSIIHKSFSSCCLAESTNLVFERQIDNYTRLLEQDKRKFFRVQENRNQVAKQYTNKVRELDSLKSRQFSSEMIKMRGKVKILENELDQTINAYNSIISSNMKLKTEIDELRKQKLTQRKVMAKINIRIQECSQLINKEEAEIERQKEHIEQSKHGILNIKAQNEVQAKQFRQQVTNVKQNLEISKAGNQILKRRTEIEQKNQSTDSLPLVRYRLRHLIAKNKERIKVIDSYKKTMDSIWKSFEEIKEESGTNDLEDITSTFLKHEQQNHFIYEYIGKLGRQIQDLNDEIERLKENIESQKQTNYQYEQSLGATPQKIMARDTLEKQRQNYVEKIQDFEHFLSIATKEFNQLGMESDLSRFNILSQLARLEQIIDQSHHPKDELRVTYHEDVTKYTRSPPNVVEEVKESKEQRLMDSDKLREFASDFWEKRRIKPQIK